MSKPPTVLDVAGIQPSSDAESTKLLLELYRLAEEAFESPQEAADWMRRPHPMLDGKTPQECAKASSGGEQVVAILVGVKYGGVA